MKKKLTFEDGILLCKCIYQSAIEKILNGVIEEEQIFYKTYRMFDKLGIKLNNKRLDELLYMLNIENIYSII